jgi:hypothetical protein
MGAIIVTTTDLLLIMDNLQWLLPKLAAAPQTHCAQKIVNLIEVVSMQKHVFTLQFPACPLRVSFLQGTFFYLRCHH